MTDVFIVAMESEAEAILRHLADPRRSEGCGRIVYEGSFRGRSAAVVVCGIGKVNAAAGTQYAIDRFAPERIVNLGVAGGIDPSMKVGEVYAASRCFQCDFDLSEINHTPKGTPDEYEGPYFELASCTDLLTAPELPSAIVATGDFYRNADDDRDFVYGEMGAWIRDMELAAIAHVCKRANVACGALKAISDVHVDCAASPISQYQANTKRAVDALAAVFG